MPNLGTNSWLNRFVGGYDGSRSDRLLPRRGGADSRIQVRWDGEAASERVRGHRVVRETMQVYNQESSTESDTTPPNRRFAFRELVFEESYNQMGWQPQTDPPASQGAQPVHWLDEEVNLPPQGAGRAVGGWVNPIASEVQQPAQSNQVDPWENQPYSSGRTWGQRRQPTLQLQASPRPRRRSSSRPRTSPSRPRTSPSRSTAANPYASSRRSTRPRDTVGTGYFQHRDFIPAPVVPLTSSESSDRDSSE